MLSQKATYRIGAVGGFACAALFALGWALWRLPSLPDMNSAADVTRWFVDRETQCRLAAICGTFSLGGLLCLESCLYGIFKRVEGDDETLTRIFFSGALITVAFDMVFLYFLYVVAWRPGHLSPDVTQALNDLYLAPGVACFACTMVSLLAAGYLIVRSGTLPRWTGHFAYVIAATQPLFIWTAFVHGGLFDIANGLFGVYVPLGLPVVWNLTVSVVLWRQSSTVATTIATPRLGTAL